ncbi:MAG: transposase, partial [Candidatus Dormibacteraeota bacterium]|nr:transposase [Candidatus Dormibacteraeota bacterium]
MLDALLVPRDPRGIVLLCGYVASTAFGLIALLSPPGDPIGWAYIGVAAIGYLFIQTRGLTTFLWLLFAAGGAAVILAGEASGWVECLLGVALAVVAVTPPPAEYREPVYPAVEAIKTARVLASGISTSGNAEVPQVGTSGKDDVAELELFSATISVTSSIQLTSYSEVTPMMGLKAVEPKLYLSFSLDAAVPSNHLVRRLAAAVDFSFIRSMVKGSYSHTGQPSVDPVVLFKLSLLGYLYGIRSERRVCEEAGLNLAWRWFIGYELDEPVPDHSVLSKARRRFGQAVYERFFKRILQLCEQRGLVEGDVVFLDSTLSKANASAKSLRSRTLVDQRRLTSPKDFVAELWAADDEEDPEATAPR